MGKLQAGAANETKVGQAVQDMIDSKIGENIKAKAKTTTLNPDSSLLSGLASLKNVKGAVKKTKDVEPYNQTIPHAEMSVKSGVAIVDDQNGFNAAGKEIKI